jgi:hypothetical protein
MYRPKRNKAEKKQLNVRIALQIPWKICWEMDSRQHLTKLMNGHRRLGVQCFFFLLVVPGDKPRFPKVYSNYPKNATQER